jgi:hypothetical protein
LLEGEGAAGRALSHAYDKLQVAPKWWLGPRLVRRSSLTSCDDDIRDVGSTRALGEH